jgi:hypothetical protein
MTQCVGEFFEVWVRPEFNWRPGEPAGESNSRLEMARVLANAQMSGIAVFGGSRGDRCEEPGEWVWGQDFVDAPDCDEDCED